jgi:ferredoxin-NADP reductase
VIEAPTSQPPEPKLRWQEATITAILADTPRVKSFMLAPSTPFPFRVGQHVDLRLTAPDSYQAERSYSIASAPEEAASIELAIERLDDGEVSPFFHDVAEVGDAIELRGPIRGHFVGRCRRRSAVFAWRRLRCGTADVIFREELFALAAG